MANNNGNATLFLTALVTALVPSYNIYQGRHMATTIPFWYLFVAYSLVYFT